MLQLNGAPRELGSSTFVSSNRDFRLSIAAGGINHALHPIEKAPAAFLWRIEEHLRWTLEPCRFVVAVVRAAVLVDRVGMPPPCCEVAAVEWKPRGHFTQVPCQKAGAAAAERGRAGHRPLLLIVFLLQIGAKYSRLVGVPSPRA